MVHNQAQNFLGQRQKKEERIGKKRWKWPTHEKMSPEPSIGKLQCVRVALWGPRGGQMWCFVGKTVP